MNRQRKAQILTVLILSCGLAVAVLRKPGLRASIGERLTPGNLVTKAADPTPQDAIYAMLDAARAGDVERYMSMYIDPIQTSMRQAMLESKDFAKYLRDSNGGVKGVAVNEPETLPDGRVKARVEYVYEDRNETQSMYLEKTRQGWKIANVDSTDRVKTLVPYGTPVQ
ncbi:MAG: hypothetical protein M3Y27_24695 [Acidobacteriota bacterium]|nr:hypothetical protein [Acidobacteriota bacterium]